METRVNFKPKYLRLYGDLHYEFDNPFRPPVDERDPDTVLLLAGDIGKARHGKGIKPSTSLLRFLIEMSAQYGLVVLVFGNHEYYADSIGHAVAKTRAVLAEEGCENVYILDNDVLQLGDDIRIIGSTLWGDFMGGDSTALFESAEKMSDYKRIRVMKGYEQRATVKPVTRKFRPMDALHLNHQAKEFITQSVESPFAGKTWVLTHHCPSYNLIQGKYRGSENYYLNGSYAANMDSLLNYAAIDLWAWGHTHDARILKESGVVLATNSFGYHGDETNAGFNPDLILNATALEPA